MNSVEVKDLEKCRKVWRRRSLSSLIWVHTRGTWVIRNIIGNLIQDLWGRVKGRDIQATISWKRNERALVSHLPSIRYLWWDTTNQRTMRACMRSCRMMWSSQIRYLHKRKDPVHALGRGLTRTQALLTQQLRSTLQLPQGMLQALILGLVTHILKRNLKRFSVLLVRVRHAINTSLVLISPLIRLRANERRRREAW